MSLFEIVLLAGIGFLAGACNAVVGGGTLFTFPVLLALGLPPVTANASNTVALWPGNIGAVQAYLPEIKSRLGGMRVRIAVVSLGGLIGGLLLLVSGNAVFFKAVPWLLSVATLLFTFSRPLVRKVFAASPHAKRTKLLLSLEFFSAVYGGYFGAAVGIILMSAMALGGEHDTHLANAQRNFLVCFINGVAAILFMCMGIVRWNVALTMMAGAIIGGYCGGYIARLIPSEILRHIITAAGASFAVYYFYRAYG